MLGDYVAVGEGGGSDSALLHQKTGGQLDSAATLIVYENGWYQVDGYQTLGQLVLVGGEVATASDRTLTLAGSSTPVVQTAGGDTVSRIRGNLSLGNNTHAFDVGTDLTLQVGAYVFNGDVVKRGAGRMNLSETTGRIARSLIVEEGTVGLNGYTGPQQAVGGDLIIGSLDNTAAPEVILQGSQQVADLSTITVNRGTFNLGSHDETITHLQMGMGQVQGTGTLTVRESISQSVSPFWIAADAIAANLNLHQAGLPIDVGALNTLTVSGKVTGSLTKLGDGNLYLTGNQANEIAYAIVNQGQLTLAKPNGVTAVNAVVIGNGSGASNATVALGANNQIDTAGGVNFFGAGLFDMNGHNQQLAWINTTAAGTGVIRTEGGTLRIGTDNTLDGVLNFDGRLHLTGAAPTWTFNKLANFTGTISNGTFRKAGNAQVTFHNVAGSVPLELIGHNTRITGETRFNALRGSGSLNIAGQLALTGAGNNTYQGTLTGAGSFIKRGNGTQTLAGAGASSFTGHATVETGGLHLDRTGGAAIGDLTIQQAGRVHTLQSQQFRSSADITVQGELVLNGYAHTAGTLNVGVGGRVHDGSLHLIDDLIVNNGTLENLQLNVGGMMQLGSGTQARQITGSITEASIASGSAVLELMQTSSTGPDLIFAGGLTVAHGVVLKLNPTMADAAYAMIDVEDHLNIVSFSVSPFVTVDLSGAGPLANGVYRLIDFTDASNLLLGQGTPLDDLTLDNFNTIGPLNGEGWFSLEGDTLVYSAVPEPGTFALVIAGSLHLLVRRRRAG